MATSQNIIWAAIVIIFCLNYKEGEIMPNSIITHLQNQPILADEQEKIVNDPAFNRIKQGDFNAG